MFKNKPTKPIQTYKINGPKFFRAYIDQFKFEQNESTIITPAAAKAVLIDLHFLCDPTGLLPEGFIISEAAKSSTIKLSTYYEGFNFMRERGEVIEVFIDNVHRYQLKSYTLYNQLGGEKGGSYFRIPKLLRGTNILATLVAARDSVGITYLLDLCSQFTVELKKGKDSISKYVIGPTMVTLKKRLNRNAKRVRSFIQLVSPLFPCELQNVKEKQPRTDRLTRVRKAVTQVFCRKVEFKLDENCVYLNNDQTRQGELQAKMYQEFLDQCKLMGISLSKKDMKDVKSALHQEVYSKASLIEDLRVRNNFIQDLVVNSIENIRTYLQNTSNKITNLGGMFRKQLQYSWKEWKSINLTSELRIEMGNAYHKNHKTYPSFL